ncbi:MAG: hypothetical protein JEZ09_07850 [Salinivirgaceae bacterium]|nr:hypothetical protein [Salinivirgaceae bacterium]
MKKIILVLLSAFLVFNLSAQSKRDIKKQRKLKKAESKNEVITFNSAEGKFASLPIWYEDVRYLLNDIKKDYKVDDKDVHLIIKAAGAAKNNIEGSNPMESARKNAWANVRKQFFDSYIEKFTASSTTVGNNTDSRISMEQSFYKFISVDNNGVSPLTEIKTYYTYDIGKETMYCYMAALIRKEEFDKRMKQIRQQEGQYDRDSRDFFEFMAKQYMEKN